MNNYRSDEINLVMQAFAKAQGCYKSLVPNEDTVQGKFANLSAMLDAVRKALSENELSFFQYLEIRGEGEGASYLRTVLGHSSGQWIGSEARILSGNTFRETSRSLESHKRIHAAMLLGIAPSKNDPMMHDDDGVAQAEKKIIDDIRSPKAAKVSEFADTISQEQYQQLMYDLEGHEGILKGILEFYTVSSLADLPKTEYYPALTRIRKIRETYQEFGKK